MKFFRLLLCALPLLTLTACASRTGPPGSPLPPQNKAVGDKWRPEVREFIDTVFAEFVDGKPTPDEQTIQRTLKATLEDLPGPLPSGLVAKKYIVTWPLGKENHVGWSSYKQYPPGIFGQQQLVVTLRIDTDRYCINPYDFAIYTGMQFKPAIEMSPTDVPSPPLPSDVQGRPYDYAYVWGMFERSPEHSYFGLDQTKQRAVTIDVSEDLRCITWVQKNTRFTPVVSSF